jgi:nucleotide-binding universal stress UspA family protein
MYDEGSMMKKILVPIDGSESADKALNLALDIARNYKAEVEILHVIPKISATLTPYPVMSGSPAISPNWIDDYYKEAQIESRKMLTEAMKLAQSKGEDLKIKPKLDKGRPSDIIVAEAEDEDFDLIVMGSRGLGGIKEYILGSVSNQVIHESKSPILIVK